MMLSQQIFLQICYYKQMKLSSNVALITGGSRGIGAAIAQLFAEHGAKIVINYHVSDYEPDAEANANSVKQKIEQAGGEAIMVEADVANEADVQRMIETAVNTFGTLNILVNNAGIVYDEPIAERTLEHWHTTFDTNVLGTYLCSKYVGDVFKKQGSGRIVNMASTSGIDALNPESIDYDATKAGIITLTKNFAQTLAPHVNVNAIAPGWVNTEMNKDLPPEFVAKETAKIYLGRFAEPEEMASIALFLASDDGRYINGSVIIADGGRGY